MKVYSFLVIMAFSLAVSLVVLIGCKYDVTEPMWDKPAATSTTVTITSIEPAQATPGWNTITIHGSDFTGAVDTSVIVASGIKTAIVYNGVTFNNVKAEVIECSSTSIKVRRPNLTGDSITVNVATTKALIEAKSSLYKIDPVKERYGSFLDNFQLDAIVVDNAENIYVIAEDPLSPFSILKVTQGAHLKIGNALRPPMDAKIGPDGRLYYVGNNTAGYRDIDAVNLQTGIATLWYHCTSQYLTCFDFDANGFIYAGSTRTKDLVKINPNHSNVANTTLYASDSILSVRVFNGYVYAVAQNFPHLAIYRNSIADTNIVGPKELVLDLTQIGFNLRNIVKSLSFSADGSKMYIGTASSNAILIATDAMNLPITPDRVDILYKGILPSYCKHFCFGNMLYMISGSTSPAAAWDVYRVDVGTSGAPHY
jgi:hypothetical protein